MKLNKNFKRFNINTECQHIFQTFIPKFKKHFLNTSPSNINPFLNTFHSLIKDHLTSCMSDEENCKFFSESNNYDDFVMYVLYRLFDICSCEITKDKLVSCLVLEEAIKSKFQSIEMWKSDCSVKFNIPVEVNDNPTVIIKSSNFIISNSENKINSSGAFIKNSAKPIVDLKQRDV